MTSVPGAGGHATTFRDPAGSVFRSGDRILRVVSESGQKPLNSFLQTATARDLVSKGNLVSTAEVRIDASTRDLLMLVERVTKGPSALYEHSPVWFPSFAYEWSPEMLYSAAQLTLDIAEKSMDDGFGLKDATPFNVLFEGAKPVFVDLCSFEKRDASNPIWLACGQFERMFLLPLLASKYCGVDPETVFTGSLDGLDADKLYRWFHFPQLLRPTLMRLVVLPHWMNQIAESNLLRGKLVSRRSIESPGADRVLRSLLRNLRTKLTDLKPRARGSAWSGYDPERLEVAEKTALVERVLGQLQPGTVLDVGCNSGTYSRIAARLGAKVVALDSDSTVAGRLWNEVSAENLDILPLVANFARPAPGMGWRNAEYASFEQRATGRFDVVLMLAVLHHIVVRDRIPLEQIFETVASYTKHSLIIEFVANDDPMFRRISAGREYLFEDHTMARFVDAASRYFDIVERRPQASGTRCLFVLRKRT